MMADPYPDGLLRRLHEYMTQSNPRLASNWDLVSLVDRQCADALWQVGQSHSAVPDDVAARHLAAITSLAAEHVHAAARPLAPSWGSRIRRVAGLTIVKVAFAAGIAAATTGGLAAEGYLPDSVQGVVADGARWVGIDLPRPAPASAPAMSDSINVDQVEEVPPQVAGTDNRAKRPATPAPFANDRAGADNPADPPAGSSPPANDDVGPPIERPENGKVPEVNGRDDQLTRPLASSLQGHEAAAEVRDTRS